MAEAKKKSVTKKSAPVKGVEVVDINGKKMSDMDIPKKLFESKINDQVLAQYVRVFRTNQRSFGARAKTRGEVTGSTRKIYRQKGTGRARHGGIRAPIFVGGGVAFGPRGYKVRLDIPKKMKKVALTSSFSTQWKKKNIVIVDGLDTLDAKTKVFDQGFKNQKLTNRVLFIVTTSNNKAKQATRNIPYVTTVKANSVNPYEVMTNKKIVLEKQAVEEIEKRWASKES